MLNLHHINTGLKVFNQYDVKLLLLFHFPQTDSPTSHSTTLVQFILH
jgi:ribonuclease BN (tRNA processing enzyme)